MDEDELDVFIEQMNSRPRPEFYWVAGLFIIFVLVMGVSISGHVDVVEVNIQEHVVEKQIVYVDSFMEQGHHYFVFTDSFCFDVPLEVYTGLDKGDFVNITTYDGASYGYLCVGGNSYISD